MTADMGAPSYIGRFAPSPSGPLHAGSIATALASWLDARAAGGRWLLRIEDIDTPRTVAGADRIIMQQLQDLGLHWDGEPVWQSRRQTLYADALAYLQASHAVYGCGCTRRETGGGIYPGTCRQGLPSGRTARAWRFRVSSGIETFEDRWQGIQKQDVEREAGDFILRRADALWAYQLAVVVDDGAQGITHVVRGADLLDSTARQRMLCRALGLSLPVMLHTPLVLDPASGLKLSKQNHAPAADTGRALETLRQAWHDLGFAPLPATQRDTFLATAILHWQARFPLS